MKYISFIFYNNTVIVLYYCIRVLLILNYIIYIINYYIKVCKLNTWGTVKMINKINIVTFI